MLAPFNKFIQAITVDFILIPDYSKSGQAKHWSYSGETGPEYWAKLNNDFILAATGKMQSPINIDTSGMAENKLHPIKFFFKKAKAKILNNGFTIVIEVDSGNYIELNGKKFELQQFHFHSLSEHTINGEHFPIEVHFVYESKTNNLAVIGVFIKKGKENYSYKNFWKLLPDLNNHAKEIILDLNNLLPSKKEYYSYMGSLTTPPCTEGVKWIIIKQPVEMSENQIAAFKLLYNNNYRPTQPLNGREIKY